MPNVNPLQLLNMIKGGKNPQQLIMSILENNARGNPVFENILSLAKQNKTNEIEQIARNLVQQSGKDFDKEFNAFKNTLGL